MDDFNETTYCERGHASLCEALDRVLHKGAVIVGEVTISVADVDLVYLGLQLVLCSVDTANGQKIDDPIDVESTYDPRR